MLGYKNIPAFWKQGLKDVEDINFKYTAMSLNKVYGIGLKHALTNIQKNGGKTDGDKVVIPVQTPAAVAMEEGFPDMYPVAKNNQYSSSDKEISFSFEGTGFSLLGQARKKNKEKQDYIFEAELYVDGVKTETAKLPTNYTTRRYDLFWKYQLENKKHTVVIKIINPKEGYEIDPGDYIVYSDKAPVNH